MDIQPGDVCAFEGCQEPATVLATGRSTYEYLTVPHPELARYCEDHASEVLNESAPEYIAVCPNCGCKFPEGS